MSGQGRNWSDLGTRTVTAIVMLVLGCGAIWLGGYWLLAVVAFAGGAMIWELAQIVAPSQKQTALILAVLSAIAVVAFFQVPLIIGVAIILIPPTLGSLRFGANKNVFALYGCAVLVACVTLILLHNLMGIYAILWIIAVVIASDTAGYFAGKAFGGPKFWPKISPKKTWSGTVAGWVAAACVGAVFMWLTDGNLLIVGLSAIVALAAQLGDIVESAIKRRFGVKDASNLLPGHGGVLDRFDALIGAALLIALIGAVYAIPTVFQ